MACRSVPGVGTVVAGTLKRGTITPGCSLMLGPDVGDGSFKLTGIKSIHYKRLPVAQVSRLVPHVGPHDCFSPSKPTQDALIAPVLTEASAADQIDHMANGEVMAV